VSATVPAWLRWAAASARTRAHNRIILGQCAGSIAIAT